MSLIRRFVAWIRGLFARHSAPPSRWRPPRHRGVSPCGTLYSCRRARLRGSMFCHKHAPQVKRIAKDRARRKATRAQHQKENRCR